MSTEPVVIIGAGPAGLSAAHELIGHGIRPLVLEKSDHVGGIARTETYKNYHYDIGGHRFLTKIGSIQQLWQEMLGDDFIKVSRMSRIFFRGRFFKYPLSIFDTLLKLGIIESVWIPLSYIKAQARPEPEEETFEQWVTNRFGQRLYETFFKTYTEKVWGIPCRQIKADWAAQRIKGLSLATALANALFGTRNAKTLTDEFYYPRKGPGMMWQSFQKAIEAGGGEVRLNAEAVRLISQDNHISKVVWRENGQLIDIPVSHLISSIPIARLVSLLQPAAPQAVLDAAGCLSHRAFIIVGLILDKASLFPDQWIYIHSKDVRVGRIQNFKNWSAEMVPDPLKTSIGMEYFCNEGDDLWKMSDAELVELGKSEITMLGLADASEVVDHFVVRQEKAYPIYDRDYDQHLRVIRSHLDTIDNLQTIGRNGMHRYNNMDHSMYTGMLAAKNVLGQDYDIWQINDDGEYLEEDTAAKERHVFLEKILAGAFARLDKLAFATASGTVCGILFFMATLWLLIKGGEVIGPNLRLLGQYFIGYTVTVKGAFIAFAYSFFWGFLFGWLIAYLRNLFFAVYAYRIRKKAEVLSMKDFFDYI
jgi:protoporphyrinogen oxidase